MDWTPESLQGLRRRLGLTQEAMAAQLRVDQCTVSSWELGRRKPGQKAVARLDRLDGQTSPGQ